MWAVNARIAAVALALLTAIGCDPSSAEGAPAEGSCQALVDEIQDMEDCELPPSTTNPSPRGMAVCVSNVTGVEHPHPCEAEVEACYDNVEMGDTSECDSMQAVCSAEDVNDGEAYRAAYAHLCETYGNTAAGFCDISASFGCEG